MENLYERRKKQWGVAFFVSLTLCAVLLIAQAVRAEAAPRTTFKMGFTVTTARPTNVIVRWKTHCHVGEGTVYRQGQFEATTPIARSLAPVGANSCHLRVVAWDIKPWAGPQGNGAVPVVTTWVTQ